jgi:hypothetical protein
MQAELWWGLLSQGSVLAVVSAGKRLLVDHIQLRRSIEWCTCEGIGCDD